jgi:hypothetical protein
MIDVLGIKFCELCGLEIKGKMIAGHHQSYEPEIRIYLCAPCHRFLHTLSKLTSEQKLQAEKWVMEYGHLWKNWTKAKYQRTQHHKDYMKSYKKIWRSLNKAHQIEYDQQYREEHKDRINETATNRRKKNPEKQRDASKKYYLNHKEEESQRHKDYVKRNYKHIQEYNSKYNLEVRNVGQSA